VILFDSGVVIDASSKSGGRHPTSNIIEFPRPK
jgi:hypothetical protein